MVKRIVAALVFISSFLTAQDTDSKSDCPDPENAKAVKLFNKYLDKKKYEYKERIEFLKKTLEEEPEYAAANYEYARQLILSSKNKGVSYKQAEPYLLKTIQLCANYHSDPYYYLGIIYWEDKKYKDCIKYMKLYLDFKSDDEKKYSKELAAFQVDAKNLIKWSKFYDEVANRTVPFNPELVLGLSSTSHEYLPYISPDGQFAFYTRQMKQKSKNAVYESDKVIEAFVESKRKADGSWDPGFLMPPPFNQGNNEGGACVTIDNKQLFFTICRDEGGAQINCDIWTTKKVDGFWTELEKVNGNVNNKDKWESQPSVSSDGKIIYFASDRPGGFGGIDIWKSIYDPATGIWGDPINLGPRINTKGDEKSPFIHSDSQTLYFSSGPSGTTGDQGHLGLGGFDIFFVKADDKGVWQEPVNIGNPINTQGDDLGFFVSLDGKRAFFASDDPRKTKGKTLGGYDIYSFELYKEARPEKVTFIEGDLTSNDGNPVKNVTVQVKDAVTKKTVDAMVDTVTGKFRVIAVDRGNDMLVKIDKQGVAFSSQLITAKDSSSEKILKVNLESKQINVNSDYTLNNIYYKTGSSDIDARSLIVLEEFADYLKKNPTIKIEIHGHTDNVGNDQDNLALSKDRSYTVFEKLIELGVKKEQVVAFKGFGKTKPIASNDTEQGRAKNRRTVFMIVGK